MRNRILSAVLLLSLSVSAHAFTGREYVEKCSPEKLGAITSDAQSTFNKALDAGSCTGFTGGVLNGANLVGQMLIKQKALKANFICLDEQLHATALVETSVSFIRSKPSLMDRPAQAGIFEALTNTYPCPVSNGQ